jgi:hypothetical protein
MPASTPERLGRKAAQTCRSRVGAFVDFDATAEADPT